MKLKLIEIVADNLKGYRQKAGYTQEDVAARMDNMHSNQYARMERADAGVTLDRIERFAKLYGIEPHMLLIPKSYE